MKLNKQNFEKHKFLYKKKVYRADPTSFLFALVICGTIFYLVYHVKVAIENDVILRLDKTPTFQEVHDYLVQEASNYYKSVSPENIRKQLHQVCTEQQFVTRFVTTQNLDYCYSIFQNFSLELSESKKMVHNLLSTLTDKILCECGSRLRLDPSDLSGLTFVPRDSSTFN